MEILPSVEVRQIDTLNPVSSVNGTQEEGIGGEYSEQGYECLVRMGLGKNKW